MADATCITQLLSPTIIYKLICINDIYFLTFYSPSLASSSSSTAAHVSKRFSLSFSPLLSPHSATVSSMCLSTLQSTLRLRVARPSLYDIHEALKELDPDAEDRGCPSLAVMLGRQ